MRISLGPCTITSERPGTVEIKRSNSELVFLNAVSNLNDKVNHFGK